MSELSIRKSSSGGKGLPEGAEVLNKNTNVRVRKIENGYIITKDIEYKYQLNDRTDWTHVTKEYYSKTDPLEIKIKNKSLADSFDE
jgi:hypothetical protein